MTWDMMLVTATLVTVLLFIILLAVVVRIWQDETPRKPETAGPSARTLAARPSVLAKVTGQESSLA
jgi:hypothetical protein